MPALARNNVRHSQSCGACGDRLPAYFAVLTPPLSLCMLCRILRRQKEPKRAVVVQHSVVPPTPAEPDAKQGATTRIVCWAMAHNNTWPSIGNFGKHEGALPSLRTIKTLWGGIVTMRGALHQDYPHILVPARVQWTDVLIAAAFRSWIVRHHGQLPTTQDLRTDATLPCPNVLHTHFKGLLMFYTHFQAGKYLSQHQEDVTERLRATSAAGHAVRRMLRDANRGHSIP